MTQTEPRTSEGGDKETYLGVIFQNAANPTFRLPDGAKPSEFFNKIDPTPGEPAINQVIRMPGYPKGSPFMLDGLMANSPGMLVGEQLNAMSAWQNTLAPPPNQTTDVASQERGAAVFNRAGCVECHSGRYFTNNDVIAHNEVGTQPSRLYRCQFRATGNGRDIAAKHPARSGC
jgi:hypothetical protein